MNSISNFADYIEFSWMNIYLSYSLFSPVFSLSLYNLGHLNLTTGPEQNNDPNLIYSLFLITNSNLANVLGSWLICESFKSWINVLGSI